MAWQDEYLSQFNTGFDTLQALGWTPNAKNDYKALSGAERTEEPDDDTWEALRTFCLGKITAGFARLTTNYDAFITHTDSIKTDLEGEKVQNIKIQIQ